MNVTVCIVNQETSKKNSTFPVHRRWTFCALFSGEIFFMLRSKLFPPVASEQMPVIVLVLMPPDRVLCPRAFRRFISEWWKCEPALLCIVESSGSNVLWNFNYCSLTCIRKSFKSFPWIRNVLGLWGNRICIIPLWSTSVLFLSVRSSQKRLKMLKISSFISDNVKPYDSKACIMPDREWMWRKPRTVFSDSPLRR